MLINKKKFYIISFIAALFIFGNKEGFFSAGASLNYILEIVAFSTLFFVTERIKKSNFIIISILSLYVVLSYVYAVTVNKALAADFLVIYKSYIYMALLLAISTTRIRLNSDLFISILRFILIAYLIVYSYQVFFTDINRPYFLAENNFEIMFICLVFLLKSFSCKPPTFLETIVFVSIGVLSGSRSGLVLTGVSLIVSNYKYISFKNITFNLLVFLLFIYSLYEILIYDLINFSLDDIDRYLFFESFFNVYLESEFLNIIFGQPRITPLPHEVCQTFLSYSNLFSNINDGTCYSVIWHTFIARILYDHGLIGFLFLIFSLFTFLRNLGYKREVIFTVIIIVFLNGLSVSSMNSVFFFLSMLFYILLSKTPARSNTDNAN